jgi:paired amphipathic helix protein Sin3a
VSTLFHGHPDLIVGFNTFLPPGYKIEVSDDHIGYIQVTHPSSRIESIAIGNPSSTYNLSITTPTSTIYQSSGIRQTSNLLNQDTDETQLANEISQQSIYSTSQAVNALISAATAPQLPYMGTTTGLNLTSKTNKQQTNNTNSSGQPVEFNHAINYVNKIKNRFHQFVFSFEICLFKHLFRCFFLEIQMYIKHFLKFFIRIKNNKKMRKNQEQQTISLSSFPKQKCIRK